MSEKSKRDLFNHLIYKARDFIEKGKELTDDEFQEYEEIKEKVEKLVDKNFNEIFNPFKFSRLVELNRLVDLNDKKDLQKEIGEKLTEKDWVLDTYFYFYYGSFYALINMIDDKYLDPEKLIKIYVNQVPVAQSEDQMLDILKIRKIYPEEYKKNLDLEEIKERIIDEVDNGPIINNNEDLEETVRGFFGRLIDTLGIFVDDVIVDSHLWDWDEELENEDE
ncbi:MAG: hypothetical protein FXF47_05325 [Candidatus Mcinerneyibacterium aminivorans]|uniref:Uncharacterized protein n=1 Tax=Candidatus Mcinerneyibacterium aminivorans TaxID=2703815 RepID=A0A5D0MBU3_9BACT|nr:MAG: hypothetical protein FXF47_05325 [Candidatus Mcinerneyibacterium aminivorans]